MYKSSKISDRFLCTMLAEVQNLHENNGDSSCTLANEFFQYYFFVRGYVLPRPAICTSTRPVKFVVCYTDTTISLKRIKEKILHIRTKRFSFYLKLRLRVHLHMI